MLHRSLDVFLRFIAVLDEDSGGTAGTGGSNDDSGGGRGEGGGVNI